VKREEVDGIRRALEELEPVVKSMVKACLDCERGHDHQDLRDVQRAMGLLNGVHGKVVAVLGKFPGL